MIDKTESKIELLVHAIINQVKLYLGILTGLIQEALKYIKSHRLGTKLIVGTIIFLTILGLALYRYIPREVTLIVDDSITISETSQKTQSRSVEDFLEENNIEIMPADKINHELDEKITKGMVVKVRKAFDVEILADGETVTLTTVSCTAEKCIDKRGIKLREDDIVLPDRDYMVKSGDKIVVKRVKIKYKKKNVVLPYDTDSVHTTKFRIGKKAVLKKGKNGKATKYYKLIYIDGKLYKTKMYKEVVHKKPVTKVIGYGSRISLDGPPKGLHYRKMIRCKAVAYHFSGNPRGAGGRPCTYGTMAVDPRVIPMGTKCYVEGYGYAIANDVGTGVKGKKIDLYMEGAFQPYMWGGRNVRVYIL